MNTKRSTFFRLLINILIIFLIVSFKPIEETSFSNTPEEEFRFALVIGNNNYENVTALNNPINDAKIMKKSLEDVGFKVLELYNANRQQMIDKIRETRAQLKGKKASFLLFYAGHGLQYNEDNWLVPTDADPQIAADVKMSCISLNFILNNLEFVETKLNIIILDACRVNPFKYAGRTTTGGLIIPTSSPKGTFLAFSTAPRQIAMDGTGTNSPYSKILANAIKIPNIPIEKTFKIVRNSLMESTEQISWENSSLLGDFYFINNQQTTLDSDGDGINDEVDQCPHLIGSIQNKGCPKAKASNQIPIAPSGMVYVKGGMFDMGDVFNEGDADERPVKEVIIKSFFMDKYEVSNGEFCDFLNIKGNQKIGGEEWIDLNSQYCLITKNSAGKFVPKQGFANYPVVEVNWYAAKAYCQWKTETQKGTYRLPTEAEWEFAARSRGKKIRFGNGKNIAKVDDMNFNPSIKEQHKYYKSGKAKGEIMPVTSYSPNELGLHNMAGNVWEWCTDIYLSDFTAAKHSARDFVIASEKKRIIKGGAWDGPASYSRATNKYNVPPRVGYLNIGFRCIKIIE